MVAHDILFIEFQLFRDNKLFSMVAFTLINYVYNKFQGLREMLEISQKYGSFNLKIMSDDKGTQTTETDGTEAKIVQQAASASSTTKSS